MKLVKYSPSSAHKQAFTLVELLAVIAIIGVLAAVLIPAIGAVRAKANQAECVQNLRTWHTALTLYAQEHKGQIPWKSWASVGAGANYYSPYMGAKKHVGSDGTAIDSQRFFRSCPAASGFGSGAVDYLFTRPSPTPNQQFTRINLAENPAKLLLMMDAHGTGLSNAASNPSILDSHVKPTCLGTENTPPRHSGNANALFADGHVESYTWDQIDGDTEAETAMRETWFKLK